MIKALKPLVIMLNKIKAFGSKIKNSAKTLKPLVMMQLKDKLDFSFLKSTKQTIAKIILSILAFGVVTGAFGSIVSMNKYLKEQDYDSDNVSE